MAGEDDWRWQRAQALAASQRPVAPARPAAATPRPAAAPPPRPSAPAAAVAPPVAAVPSQPALPGDARAGWLVPILMGVIVGIAVAAAAVVAWNQWQRLRAVDPTVVAAATPAPVARPTPRAPAAPATTPVAPSAAPVAPRAEPTRPTPPTSGPPAAAMVRGGMAQTIAPAPPRPRARPTTARPSSARKAARPAYRSATRALPTATARPSFNCRRSGTAVSQAICGDAELARLDRAMAAAYARAVASRPEAAGRLDRRQSDFLNARQQCENDRCIARLTRRRLRELER